MQTKVKIGLGIFAVAIIIAIVLVWAPWITDECAIDKVLEKIGGHGAYYRTYGSTGGDSIYDSFSVHWIPFGRFVANYEDGWFVFFYNCIIPEEKPKEITKERAIAIAKSTEEVQEFLKLYPDATLDVWESDTGCAEDIVKGVGGCRHRVPPYWLVMYYHDEDDIVNNRKLYLEEKIPFIRIAIDSQTGEILAKYPKLEYITNETYCEIDDDCLCASCCGGCTNFIYESLIKVQTENILCYTCSCTIDDDCKCVNNTCVNIINKTNSITNEQTNSALTITFLNPTMQSPNIDEKTININVSNYSIITENGYNIVGIQGAEYTSLGTNEPIIPYALINIYLPKNANMTNITINETISENIGPLNIPSFSSEIEGAYTNETNVTGLYPTHRYWIDTSDALSDDYIKIAIRLALVQYNPQTKETILYNYTKLKITYTTPTQIVPTQFSLDKTWYGVGESINATLTLENVGATNLTNLKINYTILDLGSNIIAEHQSNTFNITSGDVATISTLISTSSLPSDTYTIRATIVDSNNVPLTSTSKYLDILAGQLIDLEVPSGAIVVGDNVTFKIKFKNLKTTPLNATGKIILQDKNTRFEVANFTSNEIEVAPNQEVTFNITGDTTGLYGADYTIGGFIMFDGEIICPISEDITILTGPQLYSVLSMANEILLDETAALNLTLTNFGDINITNLQVILTLPAELSTIDSLNVNVGTLSANENKTLQWTLKGINPGYGVITINITINETISENIGPLNIPSFSSEIEGAYTNETNVTGLYPTHRYWIDTSDALSDDYIKIAIRLALIRHNPQTKETIFYPYTRLKITYATPTPLVTVLSPEKYEHLNGDPINFTISVENVGSNDLSNLYAYINVVDSSGTVLGTSSPKIFDINSGDMTSVPIQWIEYLDTGTYQIVGIVVDSSGTVLGTSYYNIYITQ